jgi:8-oxo-dGTP pyrophosphatase MutT (NUDIX family)
MATKYRKYVAAIVIFKAKKDKEPQLLILRRKQNWRGWEYVKGGLLPNESLLEALKREIREETGQRKFKIIKKLPIVIKYKWKKEFLKDKKLWKGAIQSVFLVQIFSNKIKIDKEEHSGYKFVSPKKALKLLTFREPKRALKYSLNFLSQLK